MGDNGLSEREIEILRLVATGASNKEIARMLYISPNTVKVHLKNIFTKIGAASRTEAAMYAVQNGWVERTSSGAGEVVTEVESEQPRSVPRTLVWTVASFAFMVFLAVMVLWWTNREQASSPVITGQPTPTEVSRWQRKADMPTARSRMAAVAYESQLYLIGGEDSEVVVSTVERYDTSSNSWETLQEKPTAVADVHAVVLNGMIIVPGGRLPSGKVTDIVELYDPQNGVWSRGRSLPYSLCSYAIAAFEGKVLLFGGWDGKKYVDTILSYYPVEDKWEIIGRIQSGRGYLGAGITNRKILIVGGFNGKFPVTDVEIFLPDRIDTNHGMTIKDRPLELGKYGFGMTSIADFVYLFGGISDKNRKDGLIFVPGTEEWHLIQLPSEAEVSFPGVVSLGSNVYVIGGETENLPSNTTYSYQAIYSVSIPLVP